VLEADQLADGGGNQHAIRNEMLLDFCHDLLDALLTCILLTGGDLTGLPMDCLVSYEEQNAAALQSLDACVRVIRVGAIGRRLAERRILACEPDVAGSGLIGKRVLYFENLAQAIFSPDRIVVHRQIRTCDCLYQVYWHIIGKVKSVQAIADIAIDNWVVQVRPFEDLTNGEVAVYDCLVLIESVHRIVGTEIVGMRDAWQLAHRAPDGGSCSCTTMPSSGSQLG
jgi:hypothetical protein